MLHGAHTVYLSVSIHQHFTTKLTVGFHCLVLVGRGLESKLQNQVLELIEYELEWTSNIKIHPFYI
jgi:hypothetical protein